MPSLEDVKAEWEAQRAEADKHAAKKGGGASRMKLTAFTFATFLEPEHFEGWSPDELAALGSVDAFLGVVADRIAAAGGELSDLYGILHDRDTQEVWDELVDAYKDVPKKPHPHVVGIFSSRDKGLTIAKIAKALGMEQNIIERPKKGRYAVDNMLAYLIHAKDADKAQYDPSAVVTHCGKDYMDVWRENKKSWDAGRAVKQSKVSEEDEASMVQRILDGELTRKQILLDDDMCRIYSIPTTGRAIDRALQVARDARIAAATEALDANEFKTTVLFVQGHGGTGKTAMLNGICRYLHDARGWRMPAKLAGRNALDEYDGGEVLFLDDVSASAMSAEDWLHLLDPHNASHGSARYHNTEPIAARMVIISSNKDPLEFFYYARGIGGGDRSETMDAFFRRLTMHMIVLRPQDAGYMNTQILTPQRVEPYNVLAPVNSSTHLNEMLHGLEWRLTDYEEPDTVYSPYGAAVRVLDLLDRSNRWNLSEEPGALALERDCIRGYIYREFMPNGEAMEHMPELPAPDSGELPDKTSRTMLEKQWESQKLLAEYGQSVEAMEHEAEVRQEYEEWLSEFAYRAYEGTVPDEWRRGYYLKPMPIPGVSADGGIQYIPEAGKQDASVSDEERSADDMQPATYEQWRNHIW